MKTIIAIIIAVANLLGFYPRAGIITSIDYETNSYVIEDMAGLTWCMSEPEDLWVGDQVAMLMWNHGTPETIYDDIIVNVR